MATVNNKQAHIWSVLRLIVAVCAVLFLLYSLYAENHTVHSQGDAPVAQIGGGEFIRGASVDRYQRTPSGLYDTHSQKVPESATLDDCPT